MTLRSLDRIDDRAGIAPYGPRLAFQKDGSRGLVVFPRLGMDFDDLSWMLMGGPMDHFVKLDKLPNGYQFPPDLQDRIYFDTEAHKLVFRGYMSKGEFDRLSELTRDWGFRRSLEELFRLSIPEQEPEHTGARRLFGAFGRLFSHK
jgi:hypothetical protein